MRIDDVQLLEPDQVDFNAYLAEQEAPKVRPAGHWLDDADAEPGAGYRYPWESLHGHFAMRPHELTLWTGFAKHGKTTALNQAVLAAMSQGARVGIVSLEFAIGALIRIFRWQSFGIKHGLMTGLQRDEFREWVDGRLWCYDHHGMQDGTRIAAVVWHMAKTLGLNVIVVDSLMMCGVRSDGEGFGTAQTEFLNRLINVCRESPCHVHLVAHSRKANSDDSKPAGLLDVAGHSNLVNMPHNVVSFWRNKQEVAKRSEDALFIVRGDRANGYDGAVRLWWHETARQYIEQRDADPARYCR